MKKRSIVLLILIIIIFFAGFIYFYIRNSAEVNIPSKISSSPTPNEQQTSSTISENDKGLPSPTSTLPYCNPQSLQASLSLSPGAGNVYGTFTLKNISQQTCEVLGGNFINVQYDTNTVKNISFTHIGQTQSSPFILTPNQTIYSQVHYPNGPQCQSIGINVTNITFAYKISLTNSVTFKNQNGNIEQEIQTCKAPSDITEIQIWHMSNQPITP